jgi:hypothetical protein
MTPKRQLSKTKMLSLIFHERRVLLCTLFESCRIFHVLGALGPTRQNSSLEQLIWTFLAVCPSRSESEPRDGCRVARPVSLVKTRNQAFTWIRFAPDKLSLARRSMLSHRRLGDRARWLDDPRETLTLEVSSNGFP